MYGLEMSVLLPLLAGFGIHGGRPLLPADVARALEGVPAPRVLVSTPVHLRSLVESSVTFPDIAVVVSATAPLHQELALRVEHRLRTVLVEMFGSTETCVVATRRTAQNEFWNPYPGIRLEPVAAGTVVRAPWFASDQLLHDIIEIGADRSFAVVGRHGDLAWRSLGSARRSWTSRGACRFAGRAGRDRVPAGGEKWRRAPLRRPGCCARAFGARSAAALPSGSGCGFSPAPTRHRTGTAAQRGWQDTNGSRTQAAPERAKRRSAAVVGPSSTESGDCAIAHLRWLGT